MTNLKAGTTSLILANFILKKPNEEELIQLNNLVSFYDCMWSQVRWIADKELNMFHKMKWKFLSLSRSLDRFKKRHSFPSH